MGNIMDLELFQLPDRWMKSLLSGHILRFYLSRSTIIDDTWMQNINQIKLSQ